MLLGVLILVLTVKGYAQKSPDDVRVTYTAVNKTLPRVLKDLVGISGVNIIYSENKLNKKRKINFQAKKEKLGSILHIVLEPFRMDYEVIGDNIVIVSVRSETFKKDVRISGFIRDERSGEVLPYATLYDAKNNVLIEANENGFYGALVQRKEYRFAVSYIGYRDTIYNAFFGENKIQDLVLKNENTINEIIVTDEKADKIEKFGVDRFNKTHVNHSTFVGGEADINRVIGMSAGVATGADGFGGMSVRGGNYDQNLVLFDGVPIQHSGHALGLVSIFNSNVIQEASLYKSNFPSKYGGRLSSILDIRTREGNYKKLSGEFGLSTLTSKATLEGPIIKDKASFLVSYRRTFADVWIKALSRYQNDINGDEGESSYNFYDFNAKLNFILNKNHKLFFSYYQGKDDFSNYRNALRQIETIKIEDRNRNDLIWGSKIGSLHLYSKWSSQFFSRFMIYGSDWNYESFDFDSYYIDKDSSQSEIYDLEYEWSSIQSLGSRLEMDWLVNGWLNLSFGGSINQQIFNPSGVYKNNINSGSLYPSIPTKDGIAAERSSNELENQEINGFLEAVIQFAPNTSLLLGAHASLYQINDKQYQSIQPRVLFATGSRNARFHVGASNMVQYNSIISSNQLGLPSDLWVTSTDRLKPSDAWIFTLGSSYFSNTGINVSGEVYYKMMNNLLGLDEGGNIPFDGEGNWENFIPNGKAVSYGLELEFMKRFGKYNFRTNYTYSKSTRDFADLNNGMMFDYRYDRTHMFNCNMSANLGSKADVSLNFIYGTGNPATFPTSEIIELETSNGDKYLSIIYSEKNNVRFKDYVRVDLGFNFYTKYKFGKQKFFIGVYNLLNTTNPLFLDIRRNKFDPDVYELQSVSVLPILPAINYSLSF